MKRQTSMTLALTTTLTLLLVNTAIAQEIIKDKPTPSRAEWAPLGWAYGRDYSTSDVTKVVVIGSGTPAADPRHGGISVAVVVNDQPYIIDCGPGFWRNSQANTPAYGGKIAALEPNNLNRLFLTHLHFDHTEGLSEFMLAPWVYNRKGPCRSTDRQVRRTWFATSQRPTPKTLISRCLASNSSMPRATY